VVIETPVGKYTPDAEKHHEVTETLKALRPLRHRELMRHLIAGSVASAPRSIWLSNEADGEASLSVYKTNHPAKLNQSFLLIVCTRHIFTVSPTWDGTRSAGYSEFPAYSQMLTARLPARRAAIYLRHFCYVSN
jgi:hypothetical protein